MIAAEGLNYKRAQKQTTKMERRKKLGLIDKIKEVRL